MTNVDTGGSATMGTEDSGLTARAEARKRVEARREFGSHVFVYVVVNAFLIAAWAFTGAGYFWPAWVLAGWGVGVVLHAWDAFLRRPITDADIEAELRRQHC